MVQALSSGSPAERRTIEGPAEITVRSDPPAAETPAALERVRIPRRRSPQHPVLDLLRALRVRTQAAAGALLGAYLGGRPNPPHRDPLAGRRPLYGAGALEQIRTKESIGNVAAASDGQLYASIQTAGRNQDAPPFHLARLNRDTGELEAYPSAEYQRDLGGLLGIRVIQRPQSLEGEGELLVGLDWRKSQLIAIDLGTNEPVFRGSLPEPLIAKLGLLEGGLSFHNDTAVVFDHNPDGTFYITDPQRESIGVYRPDWNNPEASTFQEILRDHASTTSGKTDIEIRGERMKLELFRVLGKSLKVPFYSGVDSIAHTPDLKGDGPHLLVSALTPNGPGQLWAIPSDVGDAKDVGRAVEQAIANGRIRPVAEVPINDGLHVVSAGGKNLVFGADVEGGGAFVVDLDGGRVEPLVRDPARVGWADGMTSELLDGGQRLRLTFSNSGLDRSLGGEKPPEEERGIYSLTVEVAELLRRLDQGNH